MEPEHLIEMREALAAVQVAAQGRDAKAGRDALRGAWAAAREYFADDAISLASFKLRLEEIGKALSARKFADARADADRTIGQIDSLLTLAVASQLVGRMPRFNVHVGNFCQARYAPDGGASLCQMFGVEVEPGEAFVEAMNSLLQLGAAGDIGADDPTDMLTEKEQEGPETRSLIALAKKEVERLAGGNRWAKLAREERPAAELALGLVNAIESRYPPPSGDLTKAHYGVVAEFVFAAALHLRAKYPTRAAKLTEEDDEG
jgi:hypothetical protein